MKINAILALVLRTDPPGAATSGSTRSKIEGVGQLEDDFAIRQVGSAGLTVNQEQIVSRAVDPIESKVEIHQILDAIIL